MKISIYNNHSLFIGGALIFLVSLVAGLITQYYILLIGPFALLLFLYGWYNLLVPFLLLVITIPFSIEYQVGNSLGTDLPDEFFMVLVALLFLFHIVNRPKSQLLEIFFHPLLMMLVGIFMWSVISSLQSTLPSLSLKYLLAKCWYLGAFVGAALIIFQRKVNLIATVLSLTIAMIIVTVVIMVRHASSQFSFATINDALYPFFRNHVNYSALLVCIFPLLWAVYNYAKSKAGRMLVVLLLVILSFALFFSYSRGAWIALLIGAMSWWLIKKGQLTKVFLLSIVFCVISAFWLMKENNYLRFAHNYQKTIFHENFQEHIIATYKLRDVSTAERFYRWIAASKMAQEKPLMGFGPNTFYHNYQPYAVPAFRTWVSNNPEHSTVHNYFLLLLTDQGVPAVLLFLILCVAVVGYAQQIYRREADQFYRTVAITAASIFMMVLTLNFLSDLIETDKIGSIFFLSISAIIVADIRTRNIQKIKSDPATHI